MKDFLKEAYQTVILWVVIFVAAFVYAYMKPNKFSCAAGLKEAESLVQELPFLGNSVKLSKPKQVKATPDTLYCIAMSSKVVGEQLKIPYKVEKKEEGIYVYINPGAVYGLVDIDDVFK